MMTRQELIERMIVASKQDRERFFKVADTIHLQPKYAEHLEELELLKQQWRDMTDLPNYPEIKFPLDLPDWFPQVKFASKWNEDYVYLMIQEFEHNNKGV